MRISILTFNGVMRKVAHFAATNTVLLFLIFFPLRTTKAQEPRPTPSPTPGGSIKLPIDKRTLEIYTKTFDSDIELASWLQSKKADRQRLINIIYVKDKTSLFIMEPLKKGGDLKYTVPPPINEALDPYNVLIRVKQNPGKTFIGVHRISDNSYVMVFRDR